MRKFKYLLVLFLSFALLLPSPKFNLSATSSKVRVRVELKMRVELKSIIKDEKLLAQVTKALLLSLAQSDYFLVVEEKEEAIIWGDLLQLRIDDETKEAYLDLHLRLTDSQTNQLLSEVKVTGRSGEKLSYKGDNSLLVSEAINDATSSAVSGLIKNLSLQGLVEIVSEKGEVLVGLGERDGLNIGAELIVIRDGKQIGKIRLTKISLASSTATIITSSPSTAIRVGDKVKVISNPSPTLAPKAKKKHKKSYLKKSLITLGAIGLVAILAGGKKGKGETEPSDTETESSTAASITLTASPSSLPADGVSTSTITALVKDSNNAAIEDGTPVRFSTSGGMIVLPGGGSLTTTSSGVAMATLRSPTSLAIDPVVVTATSGSATSNSLSISITSTPSPAASISLSATGGTTVIAIADSTGIATTTITATVRDASGNLIDGTTGYTTQPRVYFTATLGSITDSNAIGANGQATATFSSSLTGQASITATSGLARGTIEITVNPGRPHNMTVSANPPTIEANGQASSTITATIKDISGNLVMDGTKVNFLHPDTSEEGQVKVITQTGVQGLATITPVSYTTQGVAGAILVSRDPTTGLNSPSGTATIKIRIPTAQPEGISAPTNNIDNDEVKVSLVSRVAASIDVGASPYNVRGLDIVNNSSTITALVYDINHNPVPDGTAVYFKCDHGMIEGDGPTVNGVATSTTTSGVATATIYSSGSVTEGWPTGVHPVTGAFTTPTSWSWNGNVHITVTSGNVTYNAGPPYTFTTLIFSGPANQNASNASSPRDINGAEPLVGNRKDSAGIIVYATDINGHPVVDGTGVTFTTSKGVIEPSSTATVGGVAEATLWTKQAIDDEPIPAGRGFVTIKIDTGLYGAVILTVPFTVVTTP